MRLILICIIFVGSLYAHKLNVFLNQDNRSVYVSAYFASGAFCQECRVEVFNKNKTILQTGITNKDGEFIITKLDSVLNVSVEALGGHKVSNSIKPKLTQKEKVSTQEFDALKKQNIQLKREIELLKEKNSFADILKMMFALLVIVSIFFVLKRVKK